jgi:hypothetical protein
MTLNAIFIITNQFLTSKSYIFNMVGRIFWQKKSRSIGRHFQNGRRQNRQNFNVLWFQWKCISRVILKWGIDFQKTLKLYQFCWRSFWK